MGWLANISDSDDPDTFFVAGHDRFAEDLEPLEGCPVIVKQEKVGEHFGRYWIEANKVPSTDHPDRQSVEEAFNELVVEMNGTPGLSNVETED